ncbi:LysE family transporter [Oricola sp.]|uniref:LysE family transporter n=1 Tax=Oricola sp. TaxID=1979950 RepID=UPI0025E38821|nr:LysE family transporter [Oricola sp.]MCI5077604.1 LysE family translocator [Oricola sp.]
MDGLFALLQQHWPHMALVFAAFVMAAASPGPAVLGIMATSMAAGRKAGMAFAAGVLTGSMTWAFLAAVGLSAWLQAFAFGLVVLKLAGGLYLLWLAWKSLRSMLAADAKTLPAAMTSAPLWLQYRRGALLHLTNPKAVLSWIAIVSVTQADGGNGAVLAATVAGCFLLGIVIFQGYALIFASRIMMRQYLKLRRAIEGVLAAVFGYAGLRLIAS